MKSVSLVMDRSVSARPAGLKGADPWPVLAIGREDGEVDDLEREEKKRKKKS